MEKWDVNECPWNDSFMYSSLLLEYLGSVLLRGTLEPCCGWELRPGVKYASWRWKRMSYIHTGSGKQRQEAAKSIYFWKYSPSLVDWTKMDPFCCYSVACFSFLALKVVKRNAWIYLWRDLGFPTFMLFDSKYCPYYGWVLKKVVIWSCDFLCFRSVQEPPVWASRWTLSVHFSGNAEPVPQWDAFTLSQPGDPPGAYLPQPQVTKRLKRTHEELHCFWCWWFMIHGFAVEHLHILWAHNLINVAFLLFSCSKYIIWSHARFILSYKYIHMCVAKGWKISGKCLENSQNFPWEVKLGNFWKCSNWDTFHGNLCECIWIDG